MINLLYRIVMFAVICFWTTPIWACSDDQNIETNQELSLRISFIENHLGIPTGPKDIMDSGTIWYNPDTKRTLDFYKGGRLDRLAGKLGYQWTCYPEDDWYDWHKVSDKCVLSKCADTSLGR